MTQFTRKINMSPGILDTGDIVDANDINELQEAIEQQSFNVMRYGAMGDGTTDDTAAIQAAYDDLPEHGGVIMIPAGRYLVSRCNLQKTKPAVFVRTGGMARRFGHNSVDSHGDAVLIGTDSDDGSAIFSIAEPVSSVINGYGFQFKGLHFDLTSGTRYGVYGENVNGVVIDDCSAYGPATLTVAQWLCRGVVNLSHGDDTSWWRITNCHTNRVGLANNGTDGAQSCNHWFIGWNVCFPGDMVNACISLIGNDRPFTIANNFEVGSWISVYGMYLDSCTRGVFIGDTGEASSPGGTFLKAESCNGNIFMPQGNSSSTGASDVLVDDDGANLILTAATTGLSDLYSGVEQNRILHSGRYSQIGLGVHGILSPTLAAKVNHWMQGRWQFVTPLHDIGGITAQYHNGSSWESWAPTGLANVSLDNTAGIAIDADHKLCRFLIGTTGAPDWPMLAFRLFQGTGSPEGEIGVTVEAVASDTTTVQQTWTATLTLDSVFQGMTFPLPWITGTYVRVTLDCPLVDSETLNLRRLALYTAQVGTTKNVAGRVFRGSGAPENVIYGSVGDIWLRTDGGENTTMYVKESGANTTTGWVAK